MLVVEYLYNLDMLQRLLSWKVSILQHMYASVCMLCMICMILTLELMILTLGLLLEWNYIRSLEYENNVLY